MRGSTQERNWFWATLGLSSVSIVAIVFAAWELVENRLFSHVDYITLHYLYITRGMLSSLLLAFWAAWFVLRERRRSEDELRRSHERYKRLLEASPAAVALYDSGLRVTEWSAASERLYGWERAEVLGDTLRTVPPEKRAELREWLDCVCAGTPVLNVETVRSGRGGSAIDVQLSLLPFQEPSGQQSFLEVTEDIRERVRMRAAMLEIEKLASMGKMAAGTAHHLNTPLAAMLLRVQMMRERTPEGPAAADLERLESGIRFCRQFLQRLLDFSRRPPARKQPEELGVVIQSVVSFLAPAIHGKNAAIALDLDAIGRRRVLADRNLLEALLSTLLTNALDAIPPGGAITIAADEARPGTIQVRVTDKGCGISAADQPHVVEPFFTTKEPGKGTGLGLAIARNIVLEHGGTIRLESRPGEGSTVFVELPVCEAAVPEEVHA